MEGFFMDFYVYIYYDPSRNNEPFYVGKGKDARAWDHFYRKGKHPFIQRLQFLKKNKIKPIIGFYGGLDEEFALFLEMELIQKFGRRDLGKGPLLNLSDGGEGNSGWICSGEVKQKISETKKGGIPWNFGIPHKETTKEKIRTANTGKTQSQETRNKRSTSLTGKSKTIEHNNRVSESKLGKKRPPFTEEWKKKMSESQKKRWDKIKERKQNE